MKTCAKPTLHPTVYRLLVHENLCFLSAKENILFLYLQLLTRFYERAWGARGRVFESLRPDHIIQ